MACIIPETTWGKNANYRFWRKKVISNGWMDRSFVDRTVNRITVLRIKDCAAKGRRKGDHEVSGVGLME